MYMCVYMHICISLSLHIFAEYTVINLAELI